jgi:Zn finger protein HypA/HybF involved in hydrogenase expression
MPDTLTPPDRFRCLDCGRVDTINDDGFTWVESSCPLPDTMDLKCPACGSTNVDEVDDTEA